MHDARSGLCEYFAAFLARSAGFPLIQKMLFAQESSQAEQNGRFPALHKMCETPFDIFVSLRRFCGGFGTGQAPALHFDFPSR